MRLPSPALPALQLAACGVQAPDELAALGLDSAPRQLALPHYAGEGQPCVILAIALVQNIGLVTCTKGVLADSTYFVG